MGVVLALLPSPLLGPAVWQPVSEQLSRRDWAVVTPVAAQAAPRTPEDVLQSFLDALPEGDDVVLIPHSNAGLYVPALTARRSVVGYVFVDAGVPGSYGRVPLAPKVFLDFLGEKADGDDLLPPWTGWWEEADVSTLFPNAQVRVQIEREQPRLPLSYFGGSLPVPAHWDDRPGAYLAFGDTYRSERQQATGRGWPVTTLSGAHLHMLVDPQRVAAEITSLLTAIGLVRIPRHPGRVEKVMTDSEQDNDRTTDLAFDAELLAGVRAAQRAFSRRIDPVRPELHRYCRRLTGNVWDAEDLVQETLARAFARAADSHRAVDRVLPWLLRIATNVFIDGWRRPAPVPAVLPDRPAQKAADPMEIREALNEVATLLPPQERAALVLKDVFDLPLAEIAAMLRTSVGAVKAALHRGRERLEAPESVRQQARTRRSAPDRRVLDSMAEAFTAYDIDRLTALLLADASSEVIGMVYEVGADTMKRGSIHHTLVLETDVRYRAEIREVDGEPLMLLWETAVDGSRPEAVSDILRVETADGRIANVRWYYFCPETIREVTGLLGLPAHTHGYRL